MKDISKYLALRYSEYTTIKRSATRLIKSIENLHSYLSSLSKIDKSFGILLSGGMDSALLASYLPEGTKAFTFKYDNNFAKEEYERAKNFAKINNLQLIDVYINWDTIKNTIDPLIMRRQAPIATIEPQLYIACETAKQYDVSRLIIGGDADIVFGGMSKMLSKDWTKEDFIQFYRYLDPKEILKEPDEIYLKAFDNYWDAKREKFMTVDFINDIYNTESIISYTNAFGLAKMKLFDPYEDLAFNYDIAKIREKPKYLIQELFIKQYNFEPPEKNPMPRPVDFYEELNEYPTSDVFRDDIDYSKLTGQQKWMIYCVDRYIKLFPGMAKEIERNTSW